MVPSSTITVTANGEHLTCGGFSLGETIYRGNFEFITDYFGGLSLSLRRGDEGAASMGSTRSEAGTPRWAMIEDSTEEFPTASSGIGSFVLPSPRRRGTDASLTHITTTPWLNDIFNIAATQQVESSLQRWAEASISSHWDISSNQLSHITNSIFFRVNNYFSLKFFV
jgi:hypothetical protein